MGFSDVIARACGGCLEALGWVGRIGRRAYGIWHEAVVRGWNDYIHQIDYLGDENRTQWLMEIRRRRRILEWLLELQFMFTSR